MSNQGYDPKFPLAHIIGIHIDNGTMDFDVECPKCKCEYVTTISQRSVPDNQFPDIQWSCLCCENVFWTEDSRDADRKIMLHLSQYLFDDE